MQDILTIAIQIVAISPFILFAIHLTELTLNEVSQYTVPYSSEPEQLFGIPIEIPETFENSIKDTPKIQPLPVGSNVIDYSKMTANDLRSECSQRGIKWRNHRGKNSHMTKQQMIDHLNT